MKITNAVKRLNEILPLSERQAELAPELRAMHRAILVSFIEQGHPLTREQLAARWPGIDLDAALAHLVEKDLIVLENGQPIGAYPMTLESTPHQVSVNGHAIRAMCALDALAVSPMFKLETKIESRCHVSGTPLELHQQDAAITAALPTDDLRFGMHWQSAQCCAAHSLCREMVFLQDAQTATAWLAEAPTEREIFTLAEAIAFAADFFAPLVETKEPV